MSFSIQVKDDLTRVLTNKSCCRKAEFIAFFLLNGNIRFGGMKQISLRMTTEHAAAARKMFVLAKEFVEEREILVYRRTRLKKNRVYDLIIPAQPGVEDFLTAIGMLGKDGWQITFPHKVEEQYLGEECCRRAYLRGAFLAAGSVTAPDSGYHLEIGSVDQAQGELLLHLLAGFGLEGKTVTKKGGQLIYLSGAEPISDFLNIVGGHRSLLEFESVRVTKEVRNNVNRVRNCDMANINKTVAAAARQCADISFVLQELGIEHLPSTLRTIADLRLNYPEASLTELAAISGLGRSALNHRLRKFSEIADNIRTYGVDGWHQIK